MLEVRGVSKSFGSHEVLKEINFTVEKGNIFAILGKNGAGKTTLFRIILSILKANTGEVYYDGQKLSKENYQMLGYLPEERSLLKKLTINQQLSFFAQLKGVKAQDLNAKIDFWLRRFDLIEYKHSKVKELSKGNQQKIQFISAILHDPEILILDEPFSGLDPFNIDLFKDVIMDLKQSGVLIIFSSHRLDYIESFCEDIIILDQGEDKINGKLSDLKKQMHEFDIRIVGEFNTSVLEEMEHVVSVDVLVNEVVVRIDDYSVVKQIFNVIKDGDIEEFKVDLLSLEEIIKKEFGGDNL